MCWLSGCAACIIQCKKIIFLKRIKRELGASRAEREGGLKMCGLCFRTSGQNSLKAKRAVTKMEWRKRKKMEEEFCMPASVDLHVITVRSNFARLTFHGTKMTHVETNGIFCRREGECVVMRVSKSTSKTCFEECVEEGRFTEENICDENRNCGCCERGHIVGIMHAVSFAGGIIRLNGGGKDEERCSVLPRIRNR